MHGHSATIDVVPSPAWKRALDVAGALVALVVFSPVLLLVALFIRLTSGGPVFFRQVRFGLGGRPFHIWKFRTMASDADAVQHHQYVKALVQSSGPLDKIDRQYRLVPGGRWLRGLALDELPQLFNVFAGQMSLVGPRPDVIPPEDYQPWQRRRFAVTPGITGLWQVRGKNQTTFDEMIELDIRYIRRRSLPLDAVILLRTPLAVLRQVSPQRRGRKDA